METSENNLIYCENPDPVRKLMADTFLRTSKCLKETDYVDLTELLNTEAIGFKQLSKSLTSESEGGQLAANKSSSDSEDFSEPLGDAKGALIQHHHHTEGQEESRTSDSFETATSELPDKGETIECPEFPNSLAKDVVLPRPHTAPPDMDKQTAAVDPELLYTDMNLYVNKNKDDISDSDDDLTIVISGQCTPRLSEDEFHFISTHEIQLTECDHDALEYESGVSSSGWELADDLRVYSFVDYASFDSDDVVAAEVEAPHQVQVSSQPENDLCASSDESLAKGQAQIHLSIRTLSRTTNESAKAREKEHIIFKRDKHVEPVAESAKCYIALPGRLHLVGNKGKGKDAQGCSSGASSAVSDLDEADKEVRNLTARAFKSLAYPYFDTINFRASSDSSASERALGLNTWSTYVDLKYGQAREQRLDSNKCTSNFQMATHNEGKSMATGLALSARRVPPVEVFALNGELVDPKTAASARQRIQLMQTLGRGGASGLLRLKETLNLRCSVQQHPETHTSERKRAPLLARNAEGRSRSMDEVTDALREASSPLACNVVGETMEGTHKKAIFASSLLKNVISKKMQFEQERKMERGEIHELYCASPSNLMRAESEPPRDKSIPRSLKRQSSRYSDMDSDYTLVCSDQLTDTTDSNACDAKDAEARQDDASMLARHTNLESLSGAGNATKKGALDASWKSTLLRSQNSAFSSWRDGREEVEFQSEHKNHQTTARGNPLHEDTALAHGESYAGGSPRTKMSHLFLPSIQVASSNELLDRAPVQTLKGDHDIENDSNSLRVEKSGIGCARSVAMSRSPEIKISLRSVKDGSKSAPYNFAKAHGFPSPKSSPGCLAALRVDASDKVPHFTVRDIRESKSKVHAPMHQVRDVRKLVKSSYHFVSLDNHDNKPAVTTTVDPHADQRALRQGPGRAPPVCSSPMVIKCQSVNTNSTHLPERSRLQLGQNKGDKQGKEGEIGGEHRGKEGIEEESGQSDLQSWSEGCKNMGAQVCSNGNIGAARLKGESMPSASSGVKIEPRAASTAPRRRMGGPEVSEGGGSKDQAANQAREKLQAAVRSMEQLYVFEGHEWKRKAEPQLPRPITDSYVLPLIVDGGAGQGADEEEEKEDDLAMAAMGISSNDIGLRGRVEQRGLQTPASVIISSKPPPTAPVPAPTPSSSTSQLGCNVIERQGVCSVATESPTRATSTGPSQPEAGNYLTIPVKPRPKPAVPTSNNTLYTFTNSSSSSFTKATATPSQPLSSLSRPQLLRGVATASPGPATVPPPFPSQRRPAVVMETRSLATPSAQATIYHQPPPHHHAQHVPMATVAMASASVAQAQPQLICFSPTRATAMAATPVETYANLATATTAAMATQRKMLLDPGTGSFYLIDTPVVDVPTPPPSLPSTTTRRLFDPESGQFVDIAAPSPLVTAPPQHFMPLPISPLALSPSIAAATYSPTHLPYLIYPGFLSPPTTAVLQPRPPAPTTGPTHFSLLHGNQETGGVNAPTADERISKATAPNDGGYLDNVYYVATGGRGQGVVKPQHHFPSPAVISVTPSSSSSQQRLQHQQQAPPPRIVAPPSFDGTTMSFVVEHR